MFCMEFIIDKGNTSLMNCSHYHLPLKQVCIFIIYLETMKEDLPLKQNHTVSKYIKSCVFGNFNTHAVKFFPECRDRSGVVFEMIKKVEVV
jgi:hypothetical protein